MIRKIIQIDEDRCTGCGDCVPNCAEGALQIIDGKARLISDLFCDGLGACVGHCPEGAMEIIEREAEPYDERKVMDYIVKGGPNVIKAHLEHLRDHGETEYLREGIAYLNELGIAVPSLKSKSGGNSGCPGSREVSFKEEENSAEEEISRSSQLRQWPIQLHLVSPVAAYYKNSDLLLAADCCGFAHPDFHKDFLKGKSLAIACPKLDSNKDVYLEKLKSMITDAEVNSITVLIMQVPCCGGLFQMAQQAVQESGRDLPLKVVVMGIRGEILKEVQVN